MYAPVSLLVAGLVLGVLTLVTLRGSPQFSLAASVPGGAAVLVTATWLCLLAAAAQLWRGSRPRKAAVLLGLAGLSWLVPEWDSPYAAPPLYASALLLASATPVLVLHAGLATRDSRLGGVAGRVTVLSGYVVCLGLLGLAPALVLDPVAMGCNNCPGNPWLVRDDAALLAQLERVGGLTLAVWLCIAAGLLARRTLDRSGRSKHAAVQLPALGFLVVLAMLKIAHLGWGITPRSSLAGVLWFAASLFLAGTALGALWLLLVRHRARRSLGRILIDLGRGQQPGLLRDAFAERLGDPTLELLYRKADGTLVDALGRPFRPATTCDCRCTALQHGGTPLGLLVQSAITSSPSGELEELVNSTHLGLEHEGLAARALSEERDLRESGIRLLSARDNERRRLERDLHDGAQQRLLGMALGLQLLTRSCPGPHVEAALHQLALAIEEVRAMAQGLSPPVLVDAGLPAALQSLAEIRDLHISAGHLGRLDTAVETTAYQLVEVASRKAPARVTLAWQDQRLRMRLAILGDLSDLTPAADRVVTLGGRIAVRHDSGTTAVEVDLPVEVWRERSAESPAAG